jgi:hypothetical protein
MFGIYVTLVFATLTISKLLGNNKAFAQWQKFNFLYAIIV